MGYSKGITWIDDTRIPIMDTEGINFSSLLRQNELGDIYGGGKGFHKKHINKMYKTEGRFTPNLLVSDDVLNDGNVSEAKANLNYKWNNTNSGSDIFISRGKYTPRSDKGSNSRYYDIDIWFNELISNLVDFNKKL